jgi:hypothetical protein
MNDLSIRTMRPDEISIAVNWAAAEGWNPGLADDACFAAVDPEGFLIGELDGAPAATVSCVNYSASFAFLGFYIVREDLRLRPNLTPAAWARLRPSPVRSRIRSRSATARGYLATCGGMGGIGGRAAQEKNTRGCYFGLLRSGRAARPAHPTLPQARRSYSGKSGPPRQKTCGWRLGQVAREGGWVEIGLACHPDYFSGRAGASTGAITCVSPIPKTPLKMLIEQP